jgi:hypothetical protein
MNTKPNEISEQKLRQSKERGFSWEVNSRSINLQTYSQEPINGSNPEPH